MIDNKIFNYIEFLNESEMPIGGVVMGSYTRLKNNGIKISTKKFNEDSEEDNLPGIGISVIDDLCELSYFSGENFRNIEIPTNSIEFPDTRETPDEISILKDSKWASNEDNIYALYEFIEDYLSEYYGEKLNSSKNPEIKAINETEILLNEFGNMENIKELHKFENTIHSFIGEDERYYKFKRKDKGPISSIEIYKKIGDRMPQLDLTMGKINECRIRLLKEIYTISKKPLGQFKENFIFSSLMTHGKLKKNPETETKLKELLKEELKFKNLNAKDKTINNNIKFIAENLISFSNPRDVEAYIRENDK